MQWLMQWFIVPQLKSLPPKAEHTMVGQTVLVRCAPRIIAGVSTIGLHLTPEACYRGPQ